MKRIFLAFVFLFLVSAGLAQASHSVAVTYTNSPDALSTSVVTVDIWRAAGNCPATGFTKIASALAGGAGTYTDSTVAGKATYCYYAVWTVDGAVSPPSTQVPVSVPLAAGVVTVTAK
jgi:hypothetical protein